MEIREELYCSGHPHITARHKTTFEITCHTDLTLQGDCIIGVSADKGAYDLSDAFCNLLRDNSAVLTTRLSAGGIICEIRSRGSDQITLDHPTDLVWRRSNYVCGRTIGIQSDYVARTIPRDLIRALQSGLDMHVLLIAHKPDDPQKTQEYAIPRLIPGF